MATRSPKKPNLFSEDLYTGFREANTASSNPRLFRGVTIIRSGLGNKRDKHLYPASAMKEAVAAGLFNDLRAFLDHPTTVEEQVQPERSVRDLVGVYRNPRFVEEGATGGRVVADLHILKSHDWIASGIRELSELGLADKVGISIIGNGVTVPEKYRENGEEFEVHRVKKFSRIKSADIVTQAGAGGGFTNLLESAREKTEHSDMDVKDILNAIAEAATAGDTAKVQDLTTKLTEAQAAAEGDVAETETADEAKPADEAEGAGDENSDADGADEAEGDEADPVEEAGDCGCGKKVKESGKLPGAGNKSGSMTKKAKLPKQGRKFGEAAAEGDVKSLREVVADLQSKVDTLREENSTLKGQKAASALRAHITKRLTESKLPKVAKDRLRGKLVLMESKAEVDAEVSFAEGMFEDIDSRFEEVEGAGGSSHEGTSGAGSAEQNLREAVTGSGLRLKTRE